MTSEQVIKRSDILNTQVITSNNGKRLGAVTEVWVDVLRFFVVALSLRDSPIPEWSASRSMYFSSISKLGDIILVDNEEAIEDIDIATYSNLMNWEVITETGEVLGKVRGFKFNGETGKIDSIAFASFGLPQIPDKLLSTYEMSVEEIISTGPNRLIAFEGAEEQVNQLTVGLLEGMGICIPSEREVESVPVLKQWTLHDDEDWGEDDEDDWGGGSTPIPIPRRPSPKPSNDDVALVPPIE